MIAFGVYYFCVIACLSSVSPSPYSGAGLVWVEEGKVWLCKVKALLGSEDTEFFRENYFICIRFDANSSDWEIKLAWFSYFLLP